MNEPTQEYLHECFEYVDGKLYWKERPRHHFKREQDRKTFNILRSGSHAGSEPKDLIDKKLYRSTITISDKPFSRSRLIYIMFFGDIQDGMVIDHINGDSTDDRIENLRCVPQSVNTYNRKKSKNNTSGVTGVHFKNGGFKKPWRCSYKENGKRKAKDFETKDEAIAFRKEWELNHPYITPRHGK